MAINRLFHRSIIKLFSGLSNLNPLKPFGGRVRLKYPGESNSAILKKYRDNCELLMDHVENNHGFACFTLKKDVAIEFSKYGGWGSNDTEASSSFRPYAVAIVDANDQPFLHVKEAFSTGRTEHEDESIAVTSHVHNTLGYEINGETVRNPLYIPPSSKIVAEVENLDAAYLDVMKSNSYSYQAKDDPKAVEALKKYHDSLIKLQGGHNEFAEKLVVLIKDILATGYKLDPDFVRAVNSIDPNILKMVDELTAPKQQLKFATL